MSAESSFASDKVDTSGTEHYMTADQFDISEFKISYYTASESNLYADLNNGERLDHPENYFELVKTAGTNDKITGFTLKVRDDLDPDSDEYELLGTIIRMRIEYSTTESGINALKDENAELGDKLEYKNTSTFDGNKAEKPDTREKNPKITKYDVTNGSSNTNENSPKTYRLEDLTQSGGAYILRYKLEVNYNKSFGTGDNITVTDRLPLGTELENITYSLNDKGEWGKSFKEADSYDFDTDSGCAVVKTAATETEGQIVTMYFPADRHEGGKITVDYTVKLPADKLDELKDEDNRITLNNHAETDGDFDMQPIVINAAEDAISKQLIKGADGVSHSLEYQLDINPECEKLALDDSGYLMVEDTINDAGGGKAAAPFRFSEVNANAVSVYVVSGDPETETPIDFEAYEDTFAFYEPQKTTMPVDLPYDVYNDKGVQHIVTNEERAAAKGDVYKLKFKIPDKTHIRIKYTYTYDLYVAIDGLDINVKNQAVITGQSLKDKSEKKFKYSKAMDDAAQAYTYDHYSLIKVSKENYLDTLQGAEFELMRYSIDGGWEYLTGYENKTAKAKFGENYHPIGIVPIGQWKKAGTGDGEVSSGMVFTTNEKGMISFPNLQKETEIGSDGSIHLDYDLEGKKPKYIYKLREIKTPDGYYIADGDGDYYFYETKNGVFTARPDSVIEDATVNGGLPASAVVNAKEVGTTIQLANDKMKFSVRKKWLDNTPAGRSDSVTVELWQSDESPAASSVPTVKVNVYLGNYNLERQNEKPFTFAFKAKKNEYFSFRIDADNVWGYSGIDGLNRDNTTFTTAQPVTGDMEFTITTQGGNFTNCDVVQLSESVISSDPLFDKTAGNAVLVDTAVLNEQNGWFAEFGKNGLDSSKYYYIVETDDIEFYNKSYVVTGLQNSGTFELENIEDTVPKSSITVNKNWLNDNESDVTSLQFEVVGYSEQISQPDSGYSAGAGTDAAVYPKAEVSLPDDSTIIVPSKTFTVAKDNATGKWSGTSPLLPLTVNGEPVYYYIREADGTDFIPISYSSNGFALSDNEPKKVTVVNQKTVSNGFELPETGGHGSKPYIVIGTVLMTCAGTLYIFKKCRMKKL
jgi:LPXTG-motif cell wall-anchored protein